DEPVLQPREPGAGVVLAPARQLGCGPVPAHDSAVAVDQGDALGDRVEHGVQQSHPTPLSAAPGSKLRGGTLSRMALTALEYQYVRVSGDGPVARLTLNRPEKRNALSLDLMRELLAALAQIRDSDARVVVLEGAGTAFSAGHDLSEMV